MSVRPRALPPTDAPRSSSAPYAVRRRKLGLRPIVTSAIAPDFMNTRRSIGLSFVCVGAGSTPLEFRRADREPHHLRQSLELHGPTQRRLARAEPPPRSLLHRRHLIVVVR